MQEKRQAKEVIRRGTVEIDPLCSKLYLFFDTPQFQYQKLIKSASRIVFLSAESTLSNFYCLGGHAWCQFEIREELRVEKG